MLPWSIRLFRLVFGVLALVAVFTNFVELEDPYFWRFFTNQSNLLAGTVLVLGALVFSRQHSPLWWDIVRGTAVLMLLVTGIVYALLLDGVYNPFDGSHRWASTVMHQVVPIVMLVEVLIVPLHRSVPMWSLVFFTVYPLAWLAYTLRYGIDTGWYPYDFLNPAVNNGASGVAITIVVMVTGFLLIAALIIRLGKVERSGRSAEPLPERVA